MSNKIIKLNEKQEEKVVGGTKTANLNDQKLWDPSQDVYCKRREEWKTDELKKSQIKEMIELFDSQHGHNLAIGDCPGCGCLVNSIGNVCEECRKQAQS